MSTSNIINSLGGGSGIDTSNLVSSLVAVERQPTETRLDTRQETIEAQISAYGALKSALSDFQSFTATLSDPATFNARSVAFPDTDVITPNAINSGAQTGTYQIEVSSIAASQNLVLETSSDKGAVLGLAGNLTIQFGAWGYVGDPATPDTFTLNESRDALSIGVEITDSLESIAAKINDLDSDLQANVVKIGSDYQLVLTAPSGENNALKITSDNTAELGIFEFNETKNDDVLETQMGSDAEMIINGLTVTRETNTVNDVIEGFDFTLNKESVNNEKVSFTVEHDNAVAEQAIRDLVEGYNLFYTTAKALTGYSRDEDNNLVKGNLATDGTAKNLVTRLRDALGSPVTGLTTGLVALTSIGIRTELDGSLSINEKDFSAALSNNFADLEALFSPRTNSDNSRVDVGLGSRVDYTPAGRYEVQVTQDATQGIVQGDVLPGAFSLTLSGDYSFSLRVSGEATSEISLSGTFASKDALAAEMQSLINGDTDLTQRGLKLDVTYDADNDRFVFENRDYGSSSTVEFISASANMANLGVSTSLVGTDGVDAQGTVDGLEAFGVGQVLLPDIESDAYGLTFTANEGAAGDAFNINFSRGLGGELNRLITQFLASDGVIAGREDRLEVELDEIDDERTKLDTRMEAYEARISAQFRAMEAIITSLQSTGDSLIGLADRLPFTAKSN